MTLIEISFSQMGLFGANGLFVSAFILGIASLLYTLLYAKDKRN